MSTPLPYRGVGINVSGLTPLTAWKQLPQEAISVLFVIKNMSTDPPAGDKSNYATLVIELSTDGVTTDAITPSPDNAAPPGQTTSWEMGPHFTRRWYRISSMSGGPSFPTIPVDVEVVCTP